MPLLDTLIPKARSARRKLILAEGQDPRVMAAAATIARSGIAAHVTVLASPQEAAVSAAGISFDGLPVTILDHTSAPEASRLAQSLYKLRQHKGMSREKADKLVKDRLYFGNMMVHEGLADGLVAGSIASTPDMVRTAFHCVGTAPGIKTASSFFAMDLAKPTPAGDSVLFYADSGVNPNPTAEQLVDIVNSSIRTH